MDAAIVAERQVQRAPVGSRAATSSATGTSRISTQAVTPQRAASSDGGAGFISTARGSSVGAGAKQHAVGGSAASQRPVVPVESVDQSEGGSVRLQLQPTDRAASPGSHGGHTPPSRDTPLRFASSVTVESGGSGGMYIPYGTSAAGPAAVAARAQARDAAGLTIRAVLSERDEDSLEASTTSPPEARVGRDGGVAATSAVELDSSAAPEHAGSQAQRGATTENRSHGQAPARDLRRLGKAGVVRRRVPGATGEPADDAEGDASTTTADARRAPCSRAARDAASDVNPATMEGVHAVRLEEVRRYRRKLLSSVHDISDRQLGVFDAMLHTPQQHKLRKQQSQRRTPVCPCLAFRAPFIRVTEHPWFERVVIATILLNCLCLAAVDPLDANNMSTRNHVLDVADSVFLILYSVEMMLKICARGLVFGPKAYLRQGWNVIDGALVVSGWIVYLPFVDDASLSSIRIVRMLRPLRTVQSVPGLRLLVNSMIASLPQLRNVMLLWLFMFVLFGISGVQLFGSMDTRCMVPASGAVPAYIPVDEHGALCNIDGGYRTCGPTPDGTPTVCTESGEAPNGDITSFANIGVAFLTIFQCITLEAWVDIMYWTEETGMLVVGSLYFVTLVVVGAIFLMNLIVAVIVTTLSVEGDAASDEDGKVHSAPAGQRIADGGVRAAMAHPPGSSVLLRRQEVGRPVGDCGSQRGGTDADVESPSGSDAGPMHRHPAAPTTPTAVQPALDFHTPSRLPITRTSRVSGHIDAVQQLGSEEAEAAASARVQSNGAGARNLPDGVFVDAAEEVRHHTSPGNASSTALDHVAQGPRARLVGGLNFSFRRHNAAAGVASASGPPATAALKSATLPDSRPTASRDDSDGCALEGASEPDTAEASGGGNGYISGGDGFARRQLPPTAPAPSPVLSRAAAQPPVVPVFTLPSGRRLSQRVGAGVATAKVLPLPSDTQQHAASRDGAPNTPGYASATAGTQRPVVVAVAGPDRPPSVKRGETAAGPPSCGSRAWVRVKVVESTVVQQTIMALIVLNTAVLGVEYHGIPRYAEDLLDVVNYVLTAVFAIEMVLKHIAYGARVYWRDYVNVFDGTIVVVSLAEIAIHLLGIMEESRGLTAMRALRLLRVFKLARRWESFNNILSAMASSLVKIAPFSILLLLFMFVYSLLGMQMFGGKLGSPPPRHNYDSFLWSFVTTFQVLTGENWNEIMYSGIEHVGWGVSVTFFVSEVVIGNYVVLNMFLAILLDHFTEVSVQQDAAKAKALAAGTAPDDVAVDTADRTPGTGVRRQRLATVGASDDTVVVLTHGSPGSLDNDLVGDELPGHELSADNVSAAPVPVAPTPSVGTAGTTTSTRGALWATSTGRLYVAEAKEASAESPAAGPRPAFSVSSRRTGLLTAPTYGAAESRRDNATTSQPTPPPARAVQGSRDTMSPTPDQAQAEAEAAVARAIQTQRVHAAAREKAAADHARLVAAYKARAKRNRQRRRRQVCGSRCGRFHRHPAYGHKAFNVVGGDSCGRHGVGELVLHPVFDAVITVFIAVACVALAMDSHDSSPELRDVLWTVNLVLTAVFGLEMVLKMYAFGLCRGRGTYLRDPWNALDFFIVIVSLLDIGLDGTLSFVKVLRFLRALRPLRAVRRLEGLRVVLHAVVKAFPAAMNVALVCLLLFFLYGIMGVNFFGGTFYRCTDPTRTCEPSLAGPTCTDDIACTGSWTPAGATDPVPRQWVNPSYADGRGTFSFDNSLVALVTLFEVASLELWHEVMFVAVDTVGVGWAPTRDNTPASALFFIVFVVVGSMFMLNLFVSVVVDNFRKLKRQQASGSLFMTEAQQQWVEMKGLVSRMRPAPLAAPPSSSSYIRTQAFRIVAHGMFDIVVMALIMLNVVVMATQHVGQSPAWEVLGVVANYVFGAVFVLEMVIKHVGLGVAQYWSSSWNTFDGVLVIVNVATVVARDAFGSGLGVDLTLFRIVRVFRIFRLVKTVPQLRLIFTTLMLSLPSMGNVGLLLLLQFFMYAVMGMSLFGGAEASEFLTDHANFKNFGRAFMLLVRMCTGESWNGIMHDVITPGDASSQVIAYLYFGSFVVLGQFMMINLFVAVILENFEREFASSCVSKVTSADLEFFADVWSSMPREGVLRRDARHLHVKHFRMLLFRLGIPLGFDPVLDTPSYRMEFIASLHVKVHARGDGIHVLSYSNVLEQVVKRALAGRHMRMDELDPDSALLFTAAKRAESHATRATRDESDSGVDGSHTSGNARRLSKAESVVYSRLAAAVVIQRAFRRMMLRLALHRAAMRRASRASQPSVSSPRSEAGVREAGAEVVIAAS